MGNDSWQDMPVYIAKETILAISSSLKKLAEDQAKKFAVVLHGGEPLMVGEQRLELLLRSLRESLTLDYPISIQTNGMLITNDILDICSQYKTNISVSLDGPQHVNDKFRVDKQGNGTYERVINGISKLKKHPDSEFLFSGLLAVIDPTTDPREVYSSFKELSVPSLDFIYRDGNHDSLPYGKKSFDSTEYGEWLTQILDLYINDPAPIKIRFLDDILRTILGGKSTKEGLGEELYGILIIETDGSLAKNDTLKSTSNEGDQFIIKQSVFEGNIYDFFKKDEFKSYYQLQHPTSEKCLQCDYLKICGGGMPLQRWGKSNGFDNPSIYCNDQILLIDSATEHILDKAN